MNRAQYIRDTFSLHQDEHSGLWVAEWFRADGSLFAAKQHADRGALIRHVRADWGHFNFDDEARAFAEIFPPHEARS